MILFGAPYYCLELYIAYTGRKPSDYVLALAGGAAVAPSSIDPWIFLLFWINWSEPTGDPHHRRRLIYYSVHRQQFISSRRMNRSNTLGTSSSSEPCQHQQIQLTGSCRLSPRIHQRSNSKKTHC